MPTFWVAIYSQHNLYYLLISLHNRYSSNNRYSLNNLYSENNLYSQNNLYNLYNSFDSFNNLKEIGCFVNCLMLEEKSISQ